MKDDDQRFNARLKLSKLDVAKRQLESAITLYFNGGDPVSTHTLAAASLQILQDLSKQRGDDTAFHNYELIKPEHRAEVRAAFRKAQNFFKHADDDAEETLDFNPEATAFYLLEAAETYMRLTAEKTAILRLFSLWFRAIWPEVFIFTEEEEQRISMVSSKFGITDKSKFFMMLLPAYTKISTLGIKS
ncbi:MAG TPA: hypothetical protein VG347_02870 [Verrucomicrobiae bacterium]|nr:hypothetical protein [Verrucomicrobiae bacterium]